MRPFLMALLLCYCATMPVLVAFPMQAPQAVAYGVSAQAKDEGRPVFDDLAAMPAPVDHRVQMASLAPIEAPLSVRDEPVQPAAVELPRPRVHVAKPEPRISLLEKAKKYIGTNPTGWSSVWCAKFIAMLAPDLAKKVDNPNWARDWASLPHTKNPKPGDIAVLKRGNGGHIGVVKAIAKNGDPILISGNTAGRHGHRIVAEGKFSKSRVIAYVTASL